MLNSFSVDCNEKIKLINLKNTIDLNLKTTL